VYTLLTLQPTTGYAYQCRNLFRLSIQLLRLYTSNIYHIRGNENGVDYLLQMFMVTARHPQTVAWHWQYIHLISRVC